MKKTVKFVSMVMTFLLAGSLLAGCKGTKKDPGGTNASSSSSVDKNAAVRIFAPDNASAKGFESGEDEKSNKFLNAIKEKTGYKNLDWVIYNQGGANSQERLNTFFASGEQIDLVLWSTPAMFKYFNTQGALQPLDDVLNKTGKELIKAVPETSWTTATFGGKKYGIPVPGYQVYNGVAQGAGLLVRQDWMDKLNLKAPKTPEELRTFLKTMKDKDPSGKGTIPYVAAAGNSGNPLDGLAPILSAFGLSVPYTVKDGKMVDTDSLYLKDALEYLAALYKEGLLDKEYIFNKTAQVNEKVGAGKAAALQAAYWDVKTYEAALAKVDPNAKLVYVPLLEGKNGMKGLAAPAPTYAFHFIPKTAKYAAEAVEIVNTYFADKELQNYVNFGKEGTHYEKKNGVLTPIQPAYNNIMYKILYRMWNDPEIWVPNAVMGGFEPAMKSYVNAGHQLTVFNINEYKPTLEVEASKAKTLGDLKNEYVAKIITGALPLSALDEYFKKADAAGRQDVLKANQEWFNKEGKAIYEKLNKK